VTNENEQTSRREQRRSKQQEQGGQGGGAASGEQAGSTQDIRDRNARLRAKAAAERQGKRERQRAVATGSASGLDASERLDDIFVRTTHAATQWLRINFRWLQWVVVGTVAVLFGIQAIRYYKRQVAAKSTDLLMQGLWAQGGTVDDNAEHESVPEELRRWDVRAAFHDDAKRLSQAEKGYQAAIEQYGRTGAGWYARLQLAGVKYDKKDYNGAISLYRQVRASDLSKSDLEVKGRAVEGVGLCLEAKANLDEALQSFRELSNLEGSLEFAVLGLYHQARLLIAQNKRDMAKGLLEKAKKRLEEDKSAAGAGYMMRAVRDLLASVDPQSNTQAQTPDFSEIMRQDPGRLQRLVDKLKQKGASMPGSEEPANPQ
jgi:tetratricopeptide (TPR) repeat protein